VRYRILAVGNIKRGFYLEGCAFYLDRLQRLATAELIEIKDGKDRDGVKRSIDESSRSLEQVDGQIVVLDERGKSLGSEQFAKTVDEWEIKGVSRISLLIGGADGHPPALHDRADAVWRLSDLTLPHELARLVLLEQLYRVETIRAGHPYHRA
jgi:23S rRNA (pseudouridine1915-N3)-methyltransferase